MRGGRGGRAKACEVWAGRFAGTPVRRSVRQILVTALQSWIHVLYLPALRGPANQAVKRGRDQNESLSEPAVRASHQDDPSGPSDSFRVRTETPAGARTDGSFFCVSFFGESKNET